MSSLEAKIVILGSQGVGKTSLVMRYCKGAFKPDQVTSTVGASFMTKRVVDTDTDTVVRLQIWDTGTPPAPFPFTPQTNPPSLQPAKNASDPSRAFTIVAPTPASSATPSRTPNPSPKWASG